MKDVVALEIVTVTFSVGYFAGKILRLRNWQVPTLDQKLRNRIAFLLVLKNKRSSENAVKEHILCDDILFYIKLRSL